MSEKKRKVAFVVVRYGKEINGGAEFHCRMLAERLVGKFDVEVLTTCVKNYLKGGNDFAAGTSIENGVSVRRFPVAPVRDGMSERHFKHRSRPVMKLRRNLYRAGLLKYISKVFPVWSWGYKADTEAFRRSVFYSPELNSYVAEHKADYDVIIGITAEYAPFYYTAMTAGEKMIAVPTLHNSKVTFRPFMTQMFPRIKYTGFNTGSEWKLAETVLGNGLGASGIISVGIEVPEPDECDTVKKKFGLPERYISYIGRIEKGKVGKFLKYYNTYAKRHPGKALPVVMVGQVFEKVGTYDGELVYTGFVTDAEKRAILQHSAVLVNPSKYESLSLIMLEALNDSIPVLVNGRCDVLKEHCVRSGYAVKYYTGRKSFCKTVDMILGDEKTYTDMARRGHDYFMENYTWDKIMPRLFSAIDYVSGQNV